MKVIFRVDASLEMGMGHVMRCLTLAQLLNKNNSSIRFICRQHEGNLIDKIRSSGFEVCGLGLLEDKKINNKLSHSHWLGTSQQQDANDCIRALKSEEIDWLIVDHYALDEEWQNELKPFCKKIMAIDDLADRKHQCDILLDQTFGRQQGDYSALVPKNCSLLLGAKYALLRPEFERWRAYSLEHRYNKTKAKQLLVNMGGVDADNATQWVIEALKTCTLSSDTNIVIIMGALSPYLKDIQAMVANFPYKVEVKVDVNNMAEMMANSDLAIGAAGATTWERCCLGLPTVQVVVAKNQEFLAKILARHNVVKLAKEAKEISCLLENSSEWMKDISGIASRVCDGLGGLRVFNKMADCKINLGKFGEVELRNYSNLDSNNSAFALNMRNHPQIKKWMYNQSSISKKEHLEFVESLKSDMSQRYFLIEWKNNIIGSINFSKIDFCNSVEFGLYVNPFLQSKGMGRILEAAVSYYAFNELGVQKIKLKVLSDNKRAIDFYNACGFEFTGTGKESQQDVLHMEKRNE